MTYEMKALNMDGSGYMIVTRDDGSTFGQNFHRMPVDNPAELVEALSTLAEERALASLPQPPKVPHRAVLDSVSVAVPINPNRARGVMP